MTAQTSLALLKQQLNIVANYNADDALLEHKLAAAEEWITSFTGVANLTMTATITEAVLQLAAYWYEQREAASFGIATAPVPFGVYDLLRAHRASVTGHVSEA